MRTCPLIGKRNKVLCEAVINGASFREVGNQAGISHSRVSQILHLAMRRMKLPSVIGISKLPDNRWPDNINDIRKHKEFWLQMLDRLSKCYDNDTSMFITSLPQQNSVSSQGNPTNSSFGEVVSIIDKIQKNKKYSELAVLNISIQSCTLSRRAKNVLGALGVKYVGDLMQYSEEKLLRTLMGRKAAVECKRFLSSHGLSLSEK
jgi:hypothetical protein